jgi:hypothetical protein
VEGTSATSARSCFVHRTSPRSHSRTFKPDHVLCTCSSTTAADGVCSCVPVGVAMATAAPPALPREVSRGVSLCCHEPGGDASSGPLALYSASTENGGTVDAECTVELAGDAEGRPVMGMGDGSGCDPCSRALTSHGRLTTTHQQQRTTTSMTTNNGRIRNDIREHSTVEAGIRYQFCADPEPNVSDQWGVALSMCEWLTAPAGPGPRAFPGRDSTTWP